MREQRNLYKGEPLRPWLQLVLVAADGATHELEALADTGNPCALVVGAKVMEQFNLGLTPGMSTNFGRLEGGWLRVQIPEVDFDSDVLAYGSEAVVEAVQESDHDFGALAGLPLLKLMEYGGDGESFWVRTR
jgi:hypothetical protein